MKDRAVELAQAAGRLLIEHLHAPAVIATKSDHANVVTAADLASERLVVDGLRESFPGHSVIAEETGCALQESEWCWVVDPLDGTSNFAAGIPWFGVLIALLRGGTPVLGVMHLPVSGETYVAETGRGAWRNGEAIRVSGETSLKNVLCAYGMDGSEDVERARRDTALLAGLLRSVRNIRATNSLVDAAFTADGRLGGMLNRSTRLWDIAAPMLIVQEAGGLYTDLQGQPLRLDVSAVAAEREYAVLAGAPVLHRQLVDIIHQHG